MATRKILDIGRGGRVQRISPGRARLRMLLALAARSRSDAGRRTASSPSSSGSTSSSPAAAAAGSLTTAKIGGVTVLASSKGFTLYSFGPDTSTTSKCNETCATNWPPAKSPVTAAGVTGRFGTITRSGGSAQATFNGHPLYTFAGDTAPGQAKGNGLNAAGGL